MAGHSKFKNIQHRKGAQDKKRAKVFTKLIKEITVAVKMAGDDINSNPRLRSAIIEAKANNMPKDNIERAIKKGSSNTDGKNFEEIRYEGYATGGVAVIVETLTDNKNRTASEVRTVFSKNGGNLGETGSVNFMFDRVGMITFVKEGLDFDSVFELALDQGAIDVEEESNEIIIITETNSLHSIATNLSEKLRKEYFSANLIWKPKAEVEINDEEKATKIIKLISLLEDLEDVQEVFANFNIKEDILEKIEY